MAAFMARGSRSSDINTVIRRFSQCDSLRGSIEATRALGGGQTDDGDSLQTCFIEHASGKRSACSRKACIAFAVRALYKLCHSLQNAPEQDDGYNEY